MGLDQYVFIRNPNRDPSRPPDVAPPIEECDKELFYWRKHADLEGWMERLYRLKGGTEVEFNCTEVELTLVDITRLAMEHKKLRTHTGFFFGSSSTYNIEQTEQFIPLATSLLEQGHQLYYTSWW